MKQQRIVHRIALLLLALLVSVTVPAAFREDVHAADPAYSVCSVCLGTGICGNCNPYNTLDTMMPAADKLGDGWIRCGFCDADGYRKCGTNHTGDGTPIGCDGSGKILCPQCNGTGQDGAEYCGVCEGTGKIDCYVCGGLGKYVCDACNGTHRMACRCREAGHPGKCPQCGGSGWTLIDYSGNVIEYGVVHYPKQGDIIDYGIRRYSTGSYNEAYGTNLTPSQYIDKKNGGTGVNGIGYYSINQPQPVLDLTGGEATQQIIANGGTVGGSGGSGGSSGGGGNSSGGGSSGGGGNSSGGGGGGSTPKPDPTPPPEPEPPVDDPDNNPYTVDVPSDSGSVAMAADDTIEMIYLLNREVAGTYLLSIQIFKQSLTGEELARLKAMTEEDFRKLKDDLEWCADNFNFFELGDPTYFDFGKDYELPVMCDVLIQLPEGAADDSVRQHHVYQITKDGWEPVFNCTTDHYEGERYLIFTNRTLGRFAVTVNTEEDLHGAVFVDRDGNSVPRENDPDGPDGDGGEQGGPNGPDNGQSGNEVNRPNGTNDPNGNGQSGEPQGSDRPGSDDSNGGNANDDPENGPAPADDTAKNGFPILPVAAGAVAVAVIAVFALKGRKKQ